jgi:hypothetical protein
VLNRIGSSSGKYATLNDVLENEDGNSDDLAYEAWNLGWNDGAAAMREVIFPEAFDPSPDSPADYLADQLAREAEMVRKAQAEKPIFTALHEMRQAADKPCERCGDKGTVVTTTPANQWLRRPCPSCRGGEHQ